MNTGVIKCVSDKSERTDSILCGGVIFKVCIIVEECSIILDSEHI